MINDIKNMSKDVQSREAEILYFVKSYTCGWLYDFRPSGDCNVFYYLLSHIYRQDLIQTIIRFSQNTVVHSGHSTAAETFPLP